MNEADAEWIVAAWLLRLVTLFCREKVAWPAGIFPRAFSDIRRCWSGTLSSADEETDGVREFRDDGTDCAGVATVSPCSSSSESSSPMAKGPLSSGMCVSDDRDSRR